ncbi:hypothetical protein K3552_09790 [Leisingera aquaemixtae]|uniref:hypothetical protein n=1 Tax=Leisingera aquaemixtae TaxID=1396826 RepID=UPI0021A89497|nr:hypothetical protein [Leisingera aquaemixtae]UWQ35836.1 hypothetical protein K3552_09790 [Leisingera aquaemixtae]
MDRSEVTAGIKEYWGQTPAGDLSLLLVDRIFSMRPEAAASLSYRNLIDLAELDALSTELLAAVNILTTSEFAILDAGGFFVDSDDESYELTSEDFDRVVRENVLVHPIIGELVEDPAAKVSPFFSLKEEVRDGSKSS